MRSIRFWVVGLLLFCLMGTARNANAADPLWPDAGDIYQNLVWEFSVPVKFKGMMQECKRAFIIVKVYDAAGGLLGEGRNMIDLLGEAPEPDFADVRAVVVNPDVGKNPFMAKRYTVDMTFDNGEIPSFNNPKIHYRAKDGSELVYHIDEPMPEMDAANAGVVGGANAIQ